MKFKNQVESKKFRPEIEGLRIVAILLVVIYHFWFNRVSGGIDVFFVLSGFLVTTTLLSRVERTGSIQIGQFLAGIAKRLLPQAVLVMLVTLIVGMYVLPITQLSSLSQHVVASFFYMENWKLAVEAVDYLAVDQAASPFQHFWSLSVQGQIYIIWPLLIAIAIFLFGNKVHLSIRKVVFALLCIVFITSISYSIYQTNTNQAWAYFDTFARVWEFSVGGMMAIILPYLKWPKFISFITGWLGLLIIVMTGVVIQVSTAFPGYIALIPISGVLLVLISANNRVKLSAESFLSLKIVTTLGGLSYGIYLWHWPLLKFYESIFDSTKLSFTHGLILLVVTIILAYFSTNFVEKPIRKIKKLSITKGLLMFVTAAIILMAVNITVVQQTSSEPLQGKAEDYIGAAALTNDAKARENIAFQPPLLEISTDIPSFYEQDECIVYNSAEVKKCSFGVLDSPDAVIALVGGSHSGHWFPALEELAEDMNFKIDLYNHDGCRFSVDDSENYKLSESCIAWNENVIEALKKDVPDLIFTTSTINKRPEVPVGYLKQWEKLEGVSTIFAIRDNPRLKKSVPDCLAENDDIHQCSAKRHEVLPAVAPWELLQSKPSNVIFADLSDYFCDEVECPAVIGNVVVYRDQHHITAMYARSLAPMLKPLLQDALVEAKRMQQQWTAPGPI